MRVYLLSCTENAEQIAAAAAKLCYSNSQVSTLMDDLTEIKTREFIDTLLNRLGHESPIEHVSFTFAVEGVSRSLLAQITRHRIASFSVQSQRYVRLDDFSFVIPPEIERDEEAREIFVDAMMADAKAYIEIADRLKERYTDENISGGIPEKKAAKMAEKRAIEDARFALPNACETKMVMTMNARSLLNFFRQRCYSRAQWEIKALADEMLRQAYEKTPNIFRNAGPSCVKSGCPEGGMTCGKTGAVRDFYRALKGGDTV